MKKIVWIPLVIIIVLLLLFVVKNRNSGELPTGIEKVTIQIDGLERYYLIYIPKDLTLAKQQNIIFAFHGGGSNAQNLMESIKMNEKADIEKFIVVYPQGLSDKKIPEQGTWNAGKDGGGYAVNNNINDLKFFDEMVKNLESKYTIKNIYATGISMGGMMSYRLACERSEKIKAIATIGSTTTLENCNPSNPVSIIDFHGTADKFIPYNGGDSYDLPNLLVVGGNYNSVEENKNLWIQNNNCNSEEKIEFQKNDVTCVSYVCEQNTKMEFCKIENGGHTWPGSEPIESRLLKGYLGETTQTISATDKMWEFFNSL